MKMLMDNSGRLFLYSDALLQMGSFEVVEVDPETKKVIPAEQVVEVDPETKKVIPAEQVVEVDPETKKVIPAEQVVEVDPETKKVIPAEQVVEPDKPAKTSTAPTATQTRKPRQSESHVVSEVVKPSKPSTDDYNIADILADV